MRILVFGDSITQGFHDTAYGGWCSQLARYAIEKIVASEYEYDTSIFNLGISADCTNLLLKRFDVEAKARLAGQEGVIVFDIGINDTQRYVDTGLLKTPLDQFEKNVTDLIERAQQYTSNIVIFGILPMIEEMVQPMPWAPNRSHSEKDVLEFDDCIKDVCEKQRVKYFSMRDVFGNRKKELLHDGIHPNTEGHQLVFERVKSVLEEEGLL